MMKLLLLVLPVLSTPVVIKRQLGSALGGSGLGSVGSALGGAGGLGSVGSGLGSGDLINGIPVGSTLNSLGGLDGLLKKLDVNALGLSDGTCSFIDYSNVLGVKNLGNSLSSVKTGVQACVCAATKTAVLQAAVKTSCGSNAVQLCQSGGAKCNCNSGFQLDGQGLCVKVPTCGANSLLQSVDGLLKCLCNSGFELVGTACSAVCPPGSSRVGGKCTCPVNFKLLNNVCVPYPSSCPENQKVSLVGGLYTCVCNSGFRLIGDVCRAVPKCLAGEVLSIIDNVPKCVCSSSFELLNGVCTKKCASNSERDSNGTCVCKANSILDAAQKCVACPLLASVVNNVCKCNDGLALVGNKCISCPTNSKLVEGICQCAEGFLLQGSKCACPTGSSLVGGVCKAIQCAVGSVLQGSKCLKVPTCVTNATPTLDTIKNVFNCVCNAGFQLLGQKCLVAPSCASDSVLKVVGEAFQCLKVPTCGANSSPSFDNVKNLFSCLCNTGFQLLGSQCLSIDSLPINNLPINNLPTNNLPVNNLPVSNLPINNLPLSGVGL